MAAKKGNKYAVGNKGGRPTKVTPALVKNAQKYLDHCKDVRTSKGVTVNLPGVAGLSRWLHISRETIYQWAKENKVFSDIYTEIMAEQEKRLTENGLAGTYNSTITKLLLTKHGYSDRNEVSGELGTNLVVTFDRAFENRHESTSRTKRSSR